MHKFRKEVLKVFFSEKKSFRLVGNMAVGRLEPNTFQKKRGFKYSFMRESSESVTQTFAGDQKSSKCAIRIRVIETAIF